MRKHSGRGREESEEQDRGANEGHWGRNRTREDRPKALLAGLRTYETIERGLVSTNPFSLFLFEPPYPLSQQLSLPFLTGLNVPCPDVVYGRGPCQV